MVSTAPERAHVSSMAGRQAQELPPGHTIPQYVSSPADSMPPCLAIAAPPASCFLPPASCLLPLASCLPPLISCLLRSCSVRWTYQARYPPMVPALRSGYVATHRTTAFEADGSRALSLPAAEPRCVCVCCSAMRAADACRVLADLTATVESCNALSATQHDELRTAIGNPSLP